MTSPVSVQEGREPRFPEHEKLRAVREKSQAIGEFLDTSGYVLCKRRYEGDNGRPRYVWKAGREKDWPPRRSDYIDGRAEHNPDFDEWNEGLEAVHAPIVTILADYFGIDQSKLDAEKAAMLDALREASS